MLELYITRKIIKRGIKQIKLTPEEIKKAAEIYNEYTKNEDKEHYRNEIIKLLIQEYSEEFSKYFVKHHNKYFEELADICYYNQYIIDNDGITMIYDLEANCNKEINKIYKKFNGKSES